MGSARKIHYAGGADPRMGAVVSAACGAWGGRWDLAAARDARPAVGVVRGVSADVSVPARWRDAVRPGSGRRHQVGSAARGRAGAMMRVGLRVMRFPLIASIHVFGVLWREVGNDIEEHRLTRRLDADGAHELNDWDRRVTHKRGDTTERFVSSDDLWRAARKEARRLWGWDGAIVEGGPWT